MAREMSGRVSPITPHVSIMIDEEDRDFAVFEVTQSGGVRFNNSQIYNEQSQTELTQLPHDLRAEDRYVSFYLSIGF